MCTMCDTAGSQLRNTPIHRVCTTLTSFLLGKLVNNSFFNLVLLQLFYKYTCIVVSSYLMDHGWQLRNSPLRLDCCTQGILLFARSNTKARQSYATPNVHKVKGRRDVKFSL